MNWNTQLADAARHYKKATDGEIDAALAEIAARANPSEGSDLADVLVNHGVTTKKGAARLRTLAARDKGPEIPG